MKINALMPAMVSENHKSFIKRYLNSGKIHLINKNRRQFVKNANGYVFACDTYLFVNFLNQNTMIFVFEKIRDLKNDAVTKLDDFNETGVEPGVILLDEDFKVQEISK